MVRTGMLLGGMLGWFLLGAAAASPAPVVAVFDIEDRTRALSDASLEQLTHYLATRLGEGGRYRVVPRATVRKRLYDSSRRSHRNCYDEACRVEMGREVAASKIVSARILELGSECRFTLQLYDLARAATDATASVKTICSSAALPEAIDQAVSRLGDLPKDAAVDPSNCSPGKIDIEGHCCWPGQDWGLVSQRCLGEPECPNGYLPDGNGCRSGCKPGRLLTAGHCCWPGQDWGVNSRRCLGKAECPEGFMPDGQECRGLNDEESRQWCLEKFKKPCLEKCIRRFPAGDYIRTCLAEKILTCAEQNTRPFACGSNPVACKKWCRKNANVVSYCLASCQDSFEREVKDCRLIQEAFCERRCPVCQENAEQVQGTGSALVTPAAPDP